VRRIYDRGVSLGAKIISLMIMSSQILSFDVMVMVLSLLFVTYNRNLFDSSTSL
jgi:hypothetical protein